VEEKKGPVKIKIKKEIIGIKKLRCANEIIT
jgi:hypothetical protein